MELWGCQCNGMGEKAGGLRWDQRIETGLRGRLRDHCDILAS